MVTWTAATNNGSAITDYDLRRCSTGCATATNWTEIEMDAAANTARSYTITTLTNSTAYQVQVRATNTHGDSEWSPSSSGTPVAQAPSRIAKPSEAQEFLVWNAPANNGASITDYDVRYSIDGGTLWTEHRPDQTSTSTSLYKHFLPGQPSGTNYVIQVRAENSVGSSQWSPSSDTFSVAARAPEEPSPVTLDPGNTSMTVLWQAPQDNGSAITDYDVRYRQHGTHTWTEWDASTDSTATSVTVTGLTNNTSYHFQVRASNGQGDSSWSPFTPVFWRPGRPDRPVPSLVPGNRSLTASWSAVDGNGSAVNDYDVEYRVQGESSWTWHVHGGTGTSATISNLTNGTTYEVKVSATNSSGGSQDSDIVTATAGAPGRPAAPTLASTDGTLTATWTAPSTNGGSAITDYDVRYRYTVASTWEYLPDTTDSTALTATLSGLHNGVTYLVQVRAGNERTGGVVSNSQWSPTATLAPGLPAAPAAPTLVSSNAALTATWVAPAANGGTLSGFKVRTCSSSCTTDSNWTVTTVSGGATTSAKVTGLTNSTAHEVQVAATSQHGTGPWSPSATGTPGAPDAPLAPGLVVGNGQLRAIWSAPAAGTAITDYDLRHSTDNGATWTEVEMDAAANTARSHTLTLTNGTTYLVQVRATNSIGDGAWSPSATGTPGTPAAPDAPSLLSGNAKLTVTWTAPTANGSAITDYDLRHSSDSGATWTVVENGTSTALTATLTTLTNGTSYQVQVRAGNANGDGAWSSSATAQAGAPEPPAAPTLTSGNAQLGVSWTAPASSGSAITDYDVRYSSDSGATWTELADATPSTDLTATIATLTNGTAYQVQVRAGNARGDGGWSPSATDKPGRPPAPSAPTLTGGTGQVTATWTAPTSNGLDITDYDVQYKKTSASDWSTWAHTGTAVTATITGLENAVGYDVRVRAESSAGDGPWSDSASATTSAVAPSAPDAPTLTKPANGQIAVTWTAPSDNGGAALTGFKVQYRTSPSGTWTAHTFTSDGSTTTTTIDGLANYTAYDVQVIATNGEGDSPWSQSATATTNALPPAAPATPTVLAGATELAVSWTAPADNNAPITDYDVRYSSDVGATWTEWDATATSTITATTITGLTSGTWYLVAVRATNAGGDSPWSTAATVLVGVPSTPQPPPPPSD